MVDPGTATADDFEPLVGRSFRAGERVLQLAAVTRGEHHPGQPRAVFTLVFTGPQDQFVGQGTVRLAEETAGELDIFLVPVAMDAGSVQYEAVFA
ncbi:MAG TPA: hypothetical protein VKY26_08290 [Actinomycetota bacterium]|nr:hypothetical protein [Actinomycetota bacterium]